MKKLFILSALALSVCSLKATAQTAAAKTSYGTAVSYEKAMSPGRLEHLLKDKQKIENMQLSGYISEVCQKEGCWLKMRTDKNIHDDILVKIKDHAFALPQSAAGKRAVVSGTVVKKMQTVAEQQHYLEDAGASAEEIAKITAPKQVFEMVVTGVEVYN